MLRRPERYIDKDGYVWVLNSQKKRVLEHRLLKTGEFIHHKDGNKSNNVIENLQLLDNVRDHRTIHSRGSLEEETLPEATELISLKVSKAMKTKLESLPPKDLHELFQILFGW